MPSGTLGFEAVGKVEDDDWEDAVEPVLRSEISEGEKVRLSTSSDPRRGWRARR
jgi:hypothetical protein